MTTAPSEHDKLVPFAEGPETAAEAVVDASPAAVWALVSDMDLAAEFSDEFRRAEWLDGATGPSVGARFLGHNGRGETTWQTECRITVCEPHEALAYQVHHSDERPLATWSYRLTDLGDGRTHLRQHVHLGPARSGLTYAIKQAPDDELAIIAGRLAALRENMQATVDGIAARVVAPT